MSGRPRRRRELAAVAALLAILAVTAGWWTLALWPPGGATPEWLARTRAVCFRPGPDGLPDTGGWLLLTGQPLGLLAILAIGWGRELRRGLSRATSRRIGRAAAVGTLLALTGGATAATLRVAAADAFTAAPVAAFDAPAAPAPPRLDRPAPPLQLVDQAGRAVTSADLRGRPSIVTFAYGHCETVCPAVVRDAARARVELLRRGTDVGLYVVTLDPWRDTPSRLPSIARAWELDGTGARVLSGTVDRVEEALDAWNVARTRDPRTGDVAHPRLICLVDPAGRLAYATNGGVDDVVALVARL